MNSFRVITVNGRMQTADAEPEIDLAAQRIALRKMPHGEVAFHDDPHTGQDLADAIPAAIEHAAACVGPDGVAKFFEGYMPEQAKGTQPVALEGEPVAWLGRASGHLYRVVDGRVVCKDRDGPEWISLWRESEVRGSPNSFEPVYPGDPRLAEWGLAEPAAQPVALEGVVYQSTSRECVRWKLVDGVAFSSINAGAKWVISVDGDAAMLSGWLAAGELKPLNVAAQASNETTAAQEQSQVSATPDAELAPGVYLTQLESGSRFFAKWSGQQWNGHALNAKHADQSTLRSDFQTRTVIRPATAQELGQ